LFCDFVIRWPTLGHAQAESDMALMDFFKSRRCGRAEVMARRLTAIRKAMPLTDDEGTLVPFEKRTVALTRQLRQLLLTIQEYDLDIASRCQAHAEYELFDSLPGAGAGAVFGPRLLVALGTDRTRYSSAEEIARYSGVAPVTERSGTKTWVHWRYCCPKFLRQTFVEWANQTRRYSYWAKAFYDRKRNEGKSHQAILCMLAFKWISILFRCWQTNTPYDESTYLFALQKSNAMAA
jgi:transposase